MMILSKLFVLLALFLPLYPVHAATAGATSQTTTMTPEINGIRQHVEIRTDDARKPVLLFASSGHQIHHDEPARFQEEILRIVDALAPVRP